VGGERHDRRGEFPRIAGCGEQSRDVVRDALAETAGVGGDDREPGGHRLQGDEPAGLRV